MLKDQWYFQVHNVSDTFNFGTHIFLWGYNFQEVFFTNYNAGLELISYSGYFLRYHQTSFLISVVFESYPIFPKWIYLKILEESSGPIYLKQGYLDSNFSLILNFLKMHLACHLSVLLWAGLGPHFLFLVGIIQWESLLHFNYAFVMFVC